MRLAQIVASPSKTLAALLGSFCLGILFGPLCLSVASLFVLVLIFFLLVVCLFLKNAKQRFLFLFALFFLVGIFRYQQSEIPAVVVTAADRVGKSVSVTGIVSSPVDHRIDSQHVIISHVFVGDEPVDGRVLVRFLLYPEVSFQDRVEFTCRLEKPEPFNGFAYDRYLNSQGVVAVCGFPEFAIVEQTKYPNIFAWILRGRDVLVTQIKLIFSEPYATFVTGLLFGGSSSFSTDLRTDFARTGTSHILAASGFNVALFSVVLLEWLLQSPLGRKKGLFVTAVILFLYLFAAGATAAVLRATLMASLLIVQKWIGRRAWMVNTVLLTLTIMLLLNPRILLDDVGFQLSFVATVSLLFVTPLFEKRFLFFPERFGIRTAIVSSVIAIIFTLPIVIWHFGQVSLVAPLVNLLVLPFIPFVMAASLIALIASFIWMPFGSLLALPVWVISFALLELIRTMSTLSFATVTVPIAHLIATVIGILLLLFLFSQRHVLGHSTHTK
ncbi:MAG: ComEC/Rec2 family competence protein [Patescibacteria group bacterium]